MKPGIDINIYQIARHTAIRIIRIANASSKTEIASINLVIFFIRLLLKFNKTHHPLLSIDMLHRDSA
jgi:hypothetical protein